MATIMTNSTSTVMKSTSTTANRSELSGLSPLFTTTNIDRTDHVLFIKGGDNSYREAWDDLVSFSTMMKETAAASSSSATTTTPTNATTTTIRRGHGGFSCGSKIRKIRNPSLEPLNIADGPTLKRFRMKQYKRKRLSKKDKEDNTEFLAPYRPLGKWLKSFGDAMDFKVTRAGYIPICFGGVFMTTVSNIRHSPVRDWSTIVQSLSRGDNIEEGHFMERIWAGLLSPPIPIQEQKSIKGRVLRIVQKDPYTGLLVLKKRGEESTNNTTTAAADASPDVVA
mmetsp:Transcript_58935/g.144160  ORF Transcript_58935/g.144160 Transcript_58935/m.144160 type:complete len:281 (-) Transcript_58935:241-1083(-)